MEIALVVVIAGAAVAAVIVPLLRGGPAADPALDPAPRRAGPAPADREAEIRRYRDALRDGTLCRRCGRANPAGSRFCAECGRRLRAGRKPRTPDRTAA